MKLKITLIILGLVSLSNADILLTVDNQKLLGKITVIGEEYIEYETQTAPGETEWIKVHKKDIIAVVDDNLNLVYPRDKFDENALNYGRIPIKNKKEKRLYELRQRENKLAQQKAEKKEKNRFKIAALVGGLSGLMLYALLGGE